MRRAALAREHTGDRKLDAIQSRTDRVAKAIPFFADGVYLEGVVVATTDTVVDHGLGRAPRGYLVLRVQGNAVPFCESLPANQPADLTRQFAFVASGASVTLDLWIF